MLTAPNVSKHAGSNEEPSRLERLRSCDPRTFCGPRFRRTLSEFFKIQQAGSSKNILERR